MEDVTKDVPIPFFGLTLKVRSSNGDTRANVERVLNQIGEVIVAEPHGLKPEGLILVLRGEPKLKSRGSGQNEF